MTVTLEDAQARLAELIDQLRPGEELIITRGEESVARLVSLSRFRRKLGTLRGSVLYMAPDFDAPLEDFKDYTE